MYYFRRPTTGTVPVNSILGLRLKKKEKLLTTEIDKYKEKIASLRQTLVKQRNRIAEQMQDIEDLKHKSIYSNNQ